MELITIFLQLGLKEEHLKVYLSNLEWGETIITNIAHKSGLPRTSVYLLMEDLLNLGLVTRIMKQDKSYYRPADPEFIKILLQRRQKEIEDSIFELNSKMTQLKAVQNTNPQKPKVEYLEGSGGIKQAYERTFAAEEIWIQCLTEEYGKIVDEKFFEEYFEKFFKKTNIRSKEILKLNDEEYVSQYRSDKNLQLRVDVPQKTETDFWVYDDKVTFVSFNKENPYALVIQDADIARSMKNMFDLAWRHASEIDPQVKRGDKIKTEF